MTIALILQPRTGRVVGVKKRAPTALRRNRTAEPAPERLNRPAHDAVTRARLALVARRAA